MTSRFSDDEPDEEWGDYPHWFAPHATPPAMVDGMEVDWEPDEPIGTLWTPDGEIDVYPERWSFGFLRYLEE